MKKTKKTKQMVVTMVLEVDTGKAGWVDGDALTVDEARKSESWTSLFRQAGFSDTIRCLQATAMRVELPKEPAKA